MTEERLQLSFGLNNGLVPGTKAAWGARLIINQEGTVDLLHDRQGSARLNESSVEHKDLESKTITWLNKKVSGGEGKMHSPAQWAFMNAERLLKEYEMRTSDTRGFVLYSDNEGAIIGSPNGSYGYLYVAAYLFEALPDGHPDKGLEIVTAMKNKDQP